MCNEIADDTWRYCWAQESACSSLSNHCQSSGIKPSSLFWPQVLSLSVQATYCRWMGTLDSQDDSLAQTCPGRKELCRIPTFHSVCKHLL